MKRVQRDNNNLTTAEEAKAKSATNLKAATEIEKAKKNIPTVQQVKKFLMSKPDYQHMTFDVQREFFGRTFKARGMTERYLP